MLGRIELIAAAPLTTAAAAGACEAPEGFTSRERLVSGDVVVVAARQFRACPRP